MTEGAKISMVCRTCGSTNVMRDAWAVWDCETQEWTLGNVFDAAQCDDCDGETSLDEVPYDAECEEAERYPLEDAR